MRSPVLIVYSMKRAICKEWLAFFSEQKARLFSFVPRFHCDVLQVNSFQSRFLTRSITVTNSG